MLFMLEEQSPISDMSAVKTSSNPDLSMILVLISSCFFSLAILLRNA